MTICDSCVSDTLSCESQKVVVVSKDDPLLCTRKDKLLFDRGTKKADVVRSRHVNPALPQAPFATAPGTLSSR